jgi:rubrerythrin
MKEQPPLGMNRTGIQMSPFDATEMQQGMPPMVPGTPGDDSALAELRSEYFEAADVVGSVPIPGTIRGVVTTGLSMLTGKSPQLLIDKLGERLAFERTGTRLYDALITKVNAKGNGPDSMSLDDLQKIRDDEARHFSILADALDTMGADPTAQTPCADVTGVEAFGLVQVVTDPRTTIGQSLHALLVAEMTDQHGWEMLIALAEDNGQGSMITDFTVALVEERSHLRQVQKWFEEATLGTSYSVGATDQSGAPTHLH